MADDQKPIYGQTPDGEEPDIVKRMSSMMAGQGNGQANDIHTVSRIYAEFRWALKTRDHTHQEVADALAACIARCQAEMKATPFRAEAIKRFEIMKKRIEEFIAEPDQAKVCGKCGLAIFICPCPKDLEV